MNEPNTNTKANDVSSNSCATTSSLPKVMTLAELDEVAKEHEGKMDAIFDHDEELGYITIKATYPYHIELSRIPDPEALIHWLDHLTGKHWMTSNLVREFIRRFYEIKGWNLYRRNL